MLPFLEVIFSPRVFGLAAVFLTLYMDFNLTLNNGLVFFIWYTKTCMINLCVWDN